jgi:hypothetical protein
MMFADVSEQVVNIPPNVGAWCLNASDDLLTKSEDRTSGKDDHIPEG